MCQTEEQSFSGCMKTLGGTRKETLCCNNLQLETSNLGKQTITYL